MHPCLIYTNTGLIIHVIKCDIPAVFGSVMNESTCIWLKDKEQNHKCLNDKYIYLSISMKRMIMYNVIYMYRTIRKSKTVHKLL